MMIDTHAHLFNEDYDDISLLLEHMKDNIIIVSGTNDETNKEVLELVSKYDNVYGTLGIHPSEIDKITDDSFNIIEANITNKKVIGIGEVGLDYYWVKDNKEEQRKLFIKQIELAKKYNKTVVVHTRDSIEDAYNVIKDYSDVKFVIHCFSSSIEMANKFIKLVAKKRLFILLLYIIIKRSLSRPFID